MISLENNRTDLDRLEELQRTAADCYGLAIRSAAQYAVEVEPEPAAEFREHLGVLEGLWRAATDADEMRSVESSFRGELREYRDITRERLTRLRADVEAAAAAMATFAGNVGANSQDHEVEIKKELHRLETISTSSDLLAMRDGIHAAIKGISSSFEQMRRNTQLVVAQLQDEIRLLHEEIQAERRVLLMDRASGVWNRQKMEVRIDELVRQNDTFCLLLVTVSNLKGLDHQHSRTVIEGALKALAKRLDGVAGERAMIGRWNETDFVAILDVDTTIADAMCSDVTRRLSGTYPIQENGLAKIVTLRVRAGTIDRRAGQDQHNFDESLSQLSATLAVS